MDPKTSFVFPGQGSQHTGMGQELLRSSERARRTVDAVGVAADVDLTAQLADPQAPAPTDTLTTQLSVFGLSVAVAEELDELGVRPGAVAGHSLGEYAALVVGGWLDLEAAADAVARRAHAMHVCCERDDGTMAAVLGLPAEVVEDKVTGVDGAHVANLNSPRQIVVSGEPSAVAELELDAIAAGATDVVALPVAGAFHSPLMQPAEDELAATIRQLPLRQGHAQLISSVTGAPVTDVEQYREALAGQVTGTVRWSDVVTALRSHGRDIVEAGPGRVLRGLIRQTDRRQTVHNCETPDECRAVAEQLGVSAQGRSLVAAASG